MERRKRVLEPDLKQEASKATQVAQSVLSVDPAPTRGVRAWAQGG